MPPASSGRRARWPARSWHRNAPKDSSTTKPNYSNKQKPKETRYEGQNFGRRLCATAPFKWNQGTRLARPSRSSITLPASRILPNYPPLKIRLRYFFLFLYSALLLLHPKLLRARRCSDVNLPFAVPAV